MAQIIKIKRSNVANKEPAVSDLEVGEIALNMVDAKIFFKDPSNVIKEISGTSQLNSLTDVDITGLADGKILKWNATASKWNVADDSGLTYTTQIPTGTTKLRLDGSDSSTDDIEFAGSGATTVTRTSGSKLTISSTDTTYPTLTSIPDVDTGAANGQVLKWNSTTSRWSPASDSTGTTINSLNDIGNVNVASPSDGQVLTWDNSSSKWISSSSSSGGANYTNGTTAPTSPSLGDEFFDTNSDILYKRINDGSTDAWLDISTDSTLTVSYITDMTDVETGATNGQVLKWNSTTSKWSPSTDTNTDTVYTHPTTAGNKHIPTGGSAGQVLKYSASGTAVWASDDAGILQDLSTVTVGICLFPAVVG